MGFDIAVNGEIVHTEEHQVVRATFMTAEGSAGELKVGPQHNGVNIVLEIVPAGITSRLEQVEARQEEARRQEVTGVVQGQAEAKAPVTEPQGVSTQAKAETKSTKK